MSVARFSFDSNVYVYYSDEGIVCCGCSMSTPFFTSLTFSDEQEMIEHLRKHLAKGDKVPDYAFEALKEESE